MTLPPVSRLFELFDLDPSTGKVCYRKRAANRIQVGDEAGSISNVGYRLVMIDGRRIHIHRIVFAMTHGRWPTQCVDHINGDRLDNRPSNLREATVAENCRNGAIRKANKSGYKGVSWSARAQKWMAQITFNYENHYLGLFSDPKEASMAYEAAADRLFGEFSRRA